MAQRPTPNVSEERLRELRERAKIVRAQVELDREQIAAEGREVVAQLRARQPKEQSNAAEPRDLFNGKP